MKIKLIALGEKMPKWVNEGFNDYAKRLKGSSIQLELIELPIAKRGKSGSIDKWLHDEAKAVEAKLHPADHLVILDVRSKPISTEGLAQKLADWQQNKPNVAILIGGPDGIGESLKQRADDKLSLSKMTFPHPIVRIIFAEQIYRAWSILQGHPYHK
ncbi:MAG: 23S rRNA (pseudouridine(1915)-N(3))-methyltransferase RlmH [Francisellaceae bacterium]